MNNRNFVSQLIVIEDIGLIKLTLLSKNTFLNELPLFLQITDNNYMAFLDSWHAENKPSILLFDQVPIIPLLYKVSNVFTHTHMSKCCTN